MKKAIQRMQNNPKDVTFAELIKVLSRCGCVVEPPNRGSHFTVFHEEVPGYIITIPKPKQSTIKEVYVKNALDLIDRIKEVLPDEWR